MTDPIALIIHRTKARMAINDEALRLLRLANSRAITFAALVDALTAAYDKGTEIMASHND